MVTAAVRAGCTLDSAAPDHAAFLLLQTTVPSMTAGRTVYPEKGRPNLIGRGTTAAQIRLEAVGIPPGCPAFGPGLPEGAPRTASGRIERRKLWKECHREIPAAGAKANAAIAYMREKRSVRQPSTHRAWNTIRPAKTARPGPSIATTRRGLSAVASDSSGSPYGRPGKSQRFPSRGGFTSRLAAFREAWHESG